MEMSEELLERFWEDMNRHYTAHYKVLGSYILEVGDGPGNIFKIWSEPEDERARQWTSEVRKTFNTIEEAARAYDSINTVDEVEQYIKRHKGLWD